MRPRRPILVAHRGLHATVPENSLAAMQAAWAAGVPWAECDVHQSPLDLVVLHDDTLDRTTEATGPVNDYREAALSDVRLRDGAGRLTEHTLPRLRDVIRAMPPTGRLLIELKAIQDFDQLVRDIDGRNVWVQSFDARQLLMASRADRHLPLAYLVETPAALAAAAEMRYPSVHLDHALLDEATARRLRRAGKSIGAWTVNAEGDLRRVVGLGVDVLITDEPSLARCVVDELCGPG